MNLRPVAFYGALAPSFPVLKIFEKLLSKKPQKFIYTSHDQLTYTNESTTFEFLKPLDLY